MKFCTLSFLANRIVFSWKHLWKYVTLQCLLAVCLDCLYLYYRSWWGLGILWSLYRGNQVHVRYRHIAWRVWSLWWQGRVLWQNQGKLQSYCSTKIVSFNILNSSGICLNYTRQVRFLHDLYIWKIPLGLYYSDILYFWLAFLTNVLLQLLFQLFSMNIYYSDVLYSSKNTY